MKGPSYRCAEGLGTTGRTITKRRTEQAGVPSTDVRAYTLIAGPGAGPECGHRNRCWNASDGQGVGKGALPQCFRWV